MLGVRGADRVFADANYWAEWNLGVSRWGSDISEKVASDYAESVQGVMKAVALDGMMMVTQADLMWREDLFDAFDFYDVSQCVEFSKAGYQVGVVSQPHVWCLHDCGWSNMSRYDKYRKIFCGEYSGYGYKYEEIQQNIRQREVMEALDRRGAELSALLEQGRDGDLNALTKLVDISDKQHLMNRTLATYIVILEIIFMEKRNGTAEFLEGGRVHSVDEMTRQFARYKYFLRRVELGFPLEGDEVYAEIAARADKRLTDLRAIAPHVTLTPEETMRRLERELGL
jgi:hypothetical protein